MNLFKSFSHFHRHGITKKFSRTTQQIKMVTGLVGEVSFDELYNKLHDRFDAQYKGFLNLEKLTYAWIKSLQGNLNLIEFYVICIIFRGCTSTRIHGKSI